MDRVAGCGTGARVGAGGSGAAGGGVGAALAGGLGGTRRPRRPPVCGAPGGGAAVAGGPRVGGAPVGGAAGGGARVAVGRLVAFGPLVELGAAGRDVDPGPELAAGDGSGVVPGSGVSPFGWLVAGGTELGAVDPAAIGGMLRVGVAAAIGVVVSIEPASPKATAAMSARATHKPRQPTTAMTSGAASRARLPPAGM